VRAVQREMLADPRVVVLGEDVGRGGIFGQYAGLQQQFGAARVIDTPISEAAIMGAGVGMALAGMRPIVEMRVVDFALCGMDEIVNQAAKNRHRRLAHRDRHGGCWRCWPITFANVLVRYFTNSSFAWTEEFSVFLMIVLALVAGSAAVARDQHIRIEYFAEGGSMRRQQARWPALAR
jgi:hypothetical protein